MLTLPVTLTRWIVRFAPLRSKRVWEHAQVLIVGALLAPGKRTVTAVLRVLGLEHEPQFQKYPRVLNRARWSSLAVARVLLGLVVETFVATGPVVIGIDDTLERRRGAKSKATGSSRDPVRSSRSHRVKARGLRWLWAMGLAEMPWAKRVWA
jgi:DDE superfamily endonuclease